MGWPGRLSAGDGRNRRCQQLALDEPLAAAQSPGLGVAAPLSARSGAASAAGTRAGSRRASKPLRSPSQAAGARAMGEVRGQQPRRRKLTLRAGTRGRAVLALLAEYPGGLSTPRCAELNGEPPGQKELTRTGGVLRDAEAAGWVCRAGKTPGRWRQGSAVIWVITGAGREAVAQAGRSRPEPPPASARERARPPEHPWADDAEKRTRAGESVASIARRHGVGRKTVERALDRRGVPHGRAARPAWASDAKTRYDAGEPADALARCYSVSHSKVTNELRKQGVRIRPPKQASQAKRAWKANQAPPEQPGSPFAPAPQR